MKKLLLNVFAALTLSFGVTAQTTVTVTATGTAGSYNTGSVNSAGVKNDGNMININSSTNAGWAKFDMTSIPAGAVVMSVNCAFTTYTSTSSTIANNLYGFIGDPAVMAGNTLYTSCTSGTSLNNTTWTANAANTKTLNAAGVTFIQNNITSNQLCIGFSRGSANTYNIYGYGGAVGQQPMLVVTYSVPPVCSGAPTAGTATASSTLACLSQNINLSLTGAVAASGLIYQWQSSPDNTTWNSIPSATLASAVVTQTATTYYQCVVTCTNSATSSTATSVQVAQNQFYNCYCVTTPGTSNTVDNIVNFTLTNSLGSILNQASSSVAPNFISYNNTPLDLVQGSASNTVAITMGSDVTQFGAAWLDFNRNGLYEASENIGLSPTSVAGGAIVTYTFAVPAGASLGTTRIRVRGGSDAIYTTDACATSAYGETEEYLVNIITPPSCLPPTSFVNTAISTSSATFTWTAGGSETAWDIFVGSNPTGTTVPTATTSTASYTATGLSPNTSYTINVRSNCGGITSSWITLIVYTGYCTPAPSSVDADGIINVSIPTGINNATGAEAGNYGNYSSQVANVFQGSSVNAAITYSTGYTYETVIWIDFNDDLDFNDAGEAVYTGTSTATIPTTLTATFNIPLAAPIGTHRLRIGGQDSGPVTPCYNGSYGTFEDYSINIQPAPTCTLTPAIGSITGPSTLNIGTPGSFSVTSLAGNIQWYQGSSATGPWTAVTSATTNPSNITLANQGTIFISAIASNPGCVNDTTNTPWQVLVNFPGDNVCNAIPLSIGTSPIYSLFGATTQTGEVAPPSVGCTVNNGWCNSTLHNTMWFTFVAPASGNVSVQSPSFDTQLAIWSATNCANLIGQATPTAPVGVKLIAANDDDGGALDASNVKASCLTPGATYYIQLDSYSAATVTSTTSIVITDLGAYDASFSGLASNYCLPASSTSLTPVVSGGVFTVSGSTTTVTSFTPSTAGTFTVTYNNVSTACITNSVTIVANTPTVMAMTSNSVVCAGSSATLTAMGATNYTWSTGNNGITEVVTPTGNTNYTLTGEANGCSATTTVAVTVNNLPTVSATASSTLLCSNFGESAVLTASTAATSYTWTDGTTTANTATTTVTPSVGTTYTLTVNDGNCSATTTIFIDAQICGGINNAQASTTGINVYPNPTNSILNITISSELSGNASIEVYDAVGKLVIKESLSSETTTINTSKLTDGIYVFKVINNNQAIKIGKIVKQ